MFRFRRLIKGLVVVGVAGILFALALLVYALVQRNRSVTLPAPSGSYAVGRVIVEWTDESRQETPASSPGHPRELTVWIWYPADPQSGAARASYLPKGWGKAREQVRGLGSILFQSPSSIHAHAFAGVPLSSAEAVYPVLIFEPGLGPAVSDYTTLLEDLASHGYIIVAVNPTYSTSAVVFSDGRVVKQSAKGNIPDNASVSETHQIGNRLLQVWVQDLVFAMDQVERINSDPQNLFYGRMDLTRIGVFGHSFGGAAAAEVCHQDTRCRAGADLDGYPYGEVIQTGLQQPFLFVWSETSDTHEAHYLQAAKDVKAIYDQLPVGYQVTIKDTRHFNFTDYSVEFSPMLKLFGLLGSMDGQRGLQISRAYVLAFFDTYLKDIESPLLQGASAPYPEVKFEAHVK